MKKCSDPWVNVDNQREEEIVNRKCCSKRITKKEYLENKWHLAYNEETRVFSINIYTE